MLLVVLKFKHYSPKDSEEGIKEILLAKDLNQAVEYINQEHLYGALDEDESKENGLFSPDDDWKKKNKEKIRSLPNRITKNEWGEYTGTIRDLIWWACGDYWQDVRDCYYGVTQYDWTDHREISYVDGVDMLLNLGLAKDIRTWKKKSPS